MSGSSYPPTIVVPLLYRLYCFLTVDLESKDYVPAYILRDNIDAL